MLLKNQNVKQMDLHHQFQTGVIFSNLLPFIKTRVYRFEDHKNPLLDRN